jgi:hypothetical protein
MIILPREKPVTEGLNSYYLNIQRLIEHYQGELGSGGIYFHSPSAEGVIYFDKDELLSGLYQGRAGELVKGRAAVDRLLAAVDEFNFVLNVYAIEPEQVYFWANIPSAETVYRDLSTEFTDLDGLIKKMMSESLTGYIEASIKEGEESGLIFFINGQIIGGSYSWKQGELNGTREARDELVQKTKESGGSFNVSRISTSKDKAAPQPLPRREASEESVIGPLEEFLDLFERTMRTGRFLKGDFNTALKKKFVEKADSYAFLDPFAGEFEYVDGEIRFEGDAPPEEVLRGVTESVKELAQEVGAWPRFSEEIGPWTEKYAGMLSRHGLSL